MQVKWLRQALRNLDREAEYIAQDSPKAAGDFVEHIRTSVLILANYPNAGRAGRVPGTRELVIDGYPYLVPYRVKHKTVELLRVFHTSKKWPERF
jgi:toxin ParE1/3/4